MKKSVWIAMGAFFLGIFLAGYVFVYLPDKKAEARSILDSSANSLGSHLFADSPAAGPDLDFIAVSEKVGPTVVQVVAERPVGQNRMSQDPFDEFWDRFFGSPNQPRRDTNPREEQTMPVQGTGFFISADGYLLTNNHIVEKAKTVTIYTVGGDEYEAKVVGTDPQTDVALLKVEGKSFPFAELGDSKSVKVGEWVLAIGNPLGMEHTVTAGIVSAKGRQLGLSDASSYEDFIQTDAAINRGNSGGPLINLKGQVIGINSNILTSSGGNIGIGFAIPSEIAKKVVLQLKDKGRVVRSRLGVQVRTANIDQDLQKALGLKDRKGALINDVDKDGPADKAGLKRMDVVTAINGQPVENSNDLRFKISDLAPGSMVDITYIRDGKQMTAKATVVELTPEEKVKPEASASSQSAGLKLEALTPILARRYGLKTERGLLITDVTAGSNAERRGLQPGDIIVEANRKKIETLDQWEALVKPLKAGDVLLLVIRREDRSGEPQEFIVTLRITE